MAYQGKMWSNRELRLFLLDDKPILLPTCWLQSFKIAPTKDRQWTCGYCGTTTECLDLCPHCNARRKSRARKARVVVSGLLPGALVLHEVDSPFILAVVYEECDDPSIYQKEKVILWLTYCEVQDKEMLGLPDCYDYKEEPLCLSFKINCNASFPIVDWMGRPQSLQECRNE